jgi:DNA invertase Pin-like site-specific DNA recombinase
LFVGTNFDNIQDSVYKGRRKGVARKRPSGLTYKPWSDSAKESKRSVPKETRIEIRRMRAAGLSFQKIANAVNVSIGTAFRISKEQK